MKKRIFYFILGCLVLALGLTLNTKSKLGVSAMNCLPNALSLEYNFTLGNFVTAMYVVFIVIQIILLKKIDIQVLAQFPFSFVFGYLVDFFRIYVPTPAPGELGYKIAFLIAGILVTSLGATLMVKGNVVLNPCDGMVATIAKVTKKEFGFCKNAFDITMVIVTCIVCLIIGGDILATVGIGTVLSALLIGRFVAIFQKLMKNM